MSVLIYHLAEPAAWDTAIRTGLYRPAAFGTEGFIHLSTAEQVAPTFGRYYAGRQDLVLLSVNQDDPTIADRLLWEASTGGDLFPHLYCELPLEAVVAVERNWVPRD